MSFDPNNVPLEYLLQPELLNERDIFNILVARCIRVDNMEHLNKEQLLSLFYRVVTPKQQRQTNNRRCAGLHQAHHENANKKLKNCDNDKLPNDTSGPGVCLDNQINGIVANSCDKVLLKRSFNGQTSNDEPKAKKARQKICWP